jgi:hypothetical protein
MILGGIRKHALSHRKADFLIIFERGTTLARI